MTRLNIVRRISHIRGGSPMFKGIQNIINKTGKYSSKPAYSEILPLHSGDQLISTAKRAQIIKETLPLLTLSKEDTATFCKSLLHRFAEFVQELPETRHSFYSRPGGFLDHALERTHVAMKLCRAYFLPPNDDLTPLTGPQTLWAYALYSASMLHDIGRVIVDLTVKIHNNHNDEGRLWLPFDGNMLTQGALYQYNFNENYPEEFRRYSSLLLAQRIMPADGFRWITSNREVFLVWMALITDDVSNSGTLGAVLDRADAQAIANYCREVGMSIDNNAAMVELGQDFAGISDVAPTTSESSAENRISGENAAASAFINWLRSEMAANSLIINTHPLFGVPGGFLIGSELLKLFIQSNPQFNSTEKVKNSLITLGLLSTNETSFTQLAENKKITGNLLANPYLLLQGLGEGLAAQYRAGISNYASHNAIKNSNQFISPTGDLVNEAQAQSLTNTLTNQRNPFSR